MIYFERYGSHRDLPLLTHSLPTPRSSDLVLSTGAITLSVTPPAAPHQRMSMSAAAILASLHIFLQIGGAAKKAVYDRALAGGPVEELPVRVALCQHGVSVEVWISE